MGAPVTKKAPQPVSGAGQFQGGVRQRAKPPGIIRSSRIRERDRMMPEFVLHMHNHAGWYTQTIAAPSIRAALVDGLDARAAFLKRDYAGKYRVEHDDPDVDYPRFRVIWDSEEPKVFWVAPLLKKGDVWWSDRFQIGSEDDCQKCGGTGLSHYGINTQCWACGDGKSPGRASGKALVETV